MRLLTAVLWMALWSSVSTFAYHHHKIRSIRVKARLGLKEDAGPHINEASHPSRQGDGDASQRFLKQTNLEESMARKAQSYGDSKGAAEQKEKVIVISIDRKRSKAASSAADFTLEESLSELSELVGTANMVVAGLIVQKSTTNSRSYIGSGKISELVELIKRTDAKTVVVDDDLSPTQQRSLENGIAKGGVTDAKVLDRTAVILDIFAQHAKSREGQLQVELAMLEYRMTRGPSAKGTSDDSGSGFRGPGETKLETDKRVIKDKIHLIKRKFDVLKAQRQTQRQERERSNLPLVALVGYTNAGKSTLMNRLTNAGVLAENMLFATLDPTTRRVRLPRIEKESDMNEALHAQQTHHTREFLLSDTVGFISKLPTQLVAAFRATLEEVTRADVLVLVCDRSNAVWEKQRNTVLRELHALNCTHVPIIEFWNKIDAVPNAEDVCRVATEQDPWNNDGERQYLDVVQSQLVLSAPFDEKGPVTSHTERDDDEDVYLAMTIDDVRPYDEERRSTGNNEAFVHNNVSVEHVLKPRYTVAGSAKTGQNMKDLFTALATIFDSLQLPYPQHQNPHSHKHGLTN